MIKNDHEVELEREMDMPENWVSNRILTRDGRGRVMEITVPNDEEEDTDVTDN